MLELKIPGCEPLQLHHLVLDYNGTIACDGEIIEGVGERLDALAKALQIHVLTADTFGSVRGQLAHVNCRLHIIPKDDQARAKLGYVEQLGSEQCVCIGNGRNDRLMLKEAALGMAVVLAEGASVAALVAADVVVHSITDALDLLLQPLRLTATLRS